MLITEYNFTVNVVMSAIYKTFIIHDLVNKLLVTKISSEKKILIFLMR